MGTPDSREYDRLKERNFRPYSKGHRMMYLKAIAQLAQRGRRVRVLEAGFGIGWGLEQMIASPILESYVGYEPNRDSFEYTKALPAVQKFQATRDLLLLNSGFEPNLDPAFDVAFCVEVIEHVPADKHLEFLKGLHQMAPVLYFSTPDIVKSPSEGVRTTDEWVRLLIEAGFAQVATDTSQWTHLFECKRIKD